MKNPKGSFKSGYQAGFEDGYRGLPMRENAALKEKLKGGGYPFNLKQLKKEPGYEYETGYAMGYEVGRLKGKGKFLNK